MSLEPSAWDGPMPAVIEHPYTPHDPLPPQPQSQTQRKIPRKSIDPPSQSTYIPNQYSQTYVSSTNRGTTNPISPELQQYQAALIQQQQSLNNSMQTLRLDTSSAYDLPSQPYRDPVSAYSPMAQPEYDLPKRPISSVVAHPERSTSLESMNRRKVSAPFHQEHNSSNRSSWEPQADVTVPPLPYFHNERGSNNSSPVYSRPDSAAYDRDSQLVPPPQGRFRDGRSSSPIDRQGRSQSPGNTLSSHIRAPSASATAARKTPDTKPKSYTDLLNVPYPQPAPPPIKLGHNQLSNVVGHNASLLSTKQTLAMYRANVKKTEDLSVKYSFAVLLLETATEAKSEAANPLPTSTEPRAELLKQADELTSEAKKILQDLADHSYPFAQYYLADGYFSGLFTKSHQPNQDKAFALFHSASKQGHAESTYRVGLSYEFGWGTRKDFPRAVQYYRSAGSKNHPGAMTRLARACLIGDLGIPKSDRKGLRWLKRAAESADAQYNSSPYELGLLHENGYGDEVFKDEAYAAQLFTQSAELGHVEAGFKLGEAYERGLLKCPRDPSLSIHFYNGAAEKGHAGAMMALCAWYMVGVEPVLRKSESEAFQWARRAAELGLPKAQYATGYFFETGIGIRKDALEANKWYVRAAEQGEERAKYRLGLIRAAGNSRANANGQGNRDDGKGKLKKSWLR